MAKTNPFRVERFMTPHPHTIGMDQSLAKAHEMMRTHQIRHLPVLHGGKLVGIVSQRDLHLMETFGAIDQEKVTVEEAMTAEVYVVEPATHLAEVARTMAEHRFGSAIVMISSKVVGVFTMVDAARALSEVLTTGAPEEPVEDLAAATEPEVAAREIAPKPAAERVAKRAVVASTKKPAAKAATKKPAAKTSTRKPAAKTSAKKPAAKTSAKKPAAKASARKPKGAKRASR
jgi:acetoin utilization protein AcuB